MPVLNPTTTLKAAGKYLTFILGGGAFGIPILKVREIIRLLDITPIPRMPEYVRGVINLRGKIVPVIDLRMKFGLPTPRIDEPLVHCRGLRRDGRGDEIDGADCRCAR